MTKHLSAAYSLVGRCWRTDVFVAWCACQLISLDEEGFAAMTSASVSDRTSAFTRRDYCSIDRLVLVGVAAVMLVASISTIATGQLERVHATPVLTSSIGAAASRPDQPGCWVSGDLVGDANPATVAAALCGK
jgi:hypothetical protein